MKVTLIDFTGSGHPDPADYAATLLLFTKNTRLQMSPGLRQEIADWPAMRKLEGLQLMARTIPSSWEMIDYTFMIEGVSRAFTHQLVRSRHMSFAQQTMRVLDVSEGKGWEFLTGPTIAADDFLKEQYEDGMEEIAQRYKDLIANGAKVEDARGILPTNILTNIVAKCNMRTFVETVRKRSSVRVQGEYREALTAMREAVEAVHPWINFFINTDSFSASHELEAKILALGLPPEKSIEMIKLIDIMRTQ